MGLFDFLKGKAKPRPTPGDAREPPDTMQEALDELGDKLGGKPRFWHYFIAHVALRDFALRGGGLPAEAAKPGAAQGFFAMILERMAPSLQIDAADAPRLAADFAIHHRRIGPLEATVVQLPPPEGPTECHFVALVPRQPGSDAQRFFTLEDAGGGVTILGGWSVDEEHLDFGEGPRPTLDAFVAAVAARL
jgi:hypothetical protein